MALPAPVAAQITALNAALTRMLTNRERINDLFEDGLGASTYSLLSAGNQTVVKNAVTSDMAAARDQISAVISALQAM